MEIAFKPVGIEDKPVFDRYYRSQRFEIAEFNFTNLFLWQEDQQIEWAEIEGRLVVRLFCDDRTKCLFYPVGEGNLKDVLRVLDEAGYFRERYLQSLSPWMVKDIEQAMPGRFRIEPVREIWDYLYLTRDLIELKGKKYHTKKNFINRFDRAYNWSYNWLDHNDMKRVEAMQQEWCEQNLCHLFRQLDAERNGILKILRYYRQLDFTCACLEVEGRIVAFTIGEMLNDDTVVIHIEKANSDFPGAYQMINRLYLEKQWPDVPYVNRECDMGLEGLRTAKESYKPVRMIEKYKMIPV